MVIEAVRRWERKKRNNMTNVVTGISPKLRIKNWRNVKKVNMKNESKIIFFVLISIKWSKLSDKETANLGENNIEKKETINLQENDIEILIF